MALTPQLPCRRAVEFMAGHEVAVAGKTKLPTNRSLGEQWSHLSKRLGELPGQIERRLDRK